MRPIKPILNDRLLPLWLGAALAGLCIFAPLSAAQQAGEEADDTLESTAIPPGEDPDEEITWLDETEEHVGRKADELARRLDNFFGEPIDDYSRAHSRLRVLVGATYDDVDELEYRFKIRGKVDLPKLERRLAIVFEGEEGEPFGKQEIEEDQNRAGFQLNVSEAGRHRFDLATNVNSSLDLRAGVRYRYDRLFSDAFDARYVQDLAYDTNKKTFTRGRLYLNYLTSETSMLRGLGRLEYGEDSRGVEWQVGSVWVFQLDEHTALSPAIYAVGQTDPELTRNYGLGVRYRTNIYKDFLFMEVIPGYVWKKPNEFVDRKGTWGIGLYFEMHFEADQDAPYGGRLGILPGSTRNPSN